MTKIIKHLIKSKISTQRFIHHWNHILLKYMNPQILTKNNTLLILKAVKLQKLRNNLLLFIIEAKEKDKA